MEFHRGAWRMKCSSQMRIQGINYQAMADKIGKSKATAWRYIHEENQVLPIEDMISICGVLGLNPHEFISLDKHDWQQVTAEHAYNMVFHEECEIRLIHKPDAIVESFVRWQGDSGDMWTGKFAAYLEGSSERVMLFPYQEVLARAIEPLEAEE
jgi:hypothetical protein